MVLQVTELESKERGLQRFLETLREQVRLFGDRVPNGSLLDHRLRHKCHIVIHTYFVSNNHSTHVAVPNQHLTRGPLLVLDTCVVLLVVCWG